jgi:hypothetical protein
MDRQAVVERRIRKDADALEQAFGAMDPYFQQARRILDRDTAWRKKYSLFETVALLRRKSRL